MRFDGRERVRFVVLIALIGIAGLLSLGYILIQQRLDNPLIDTYRVKAELPAADGVVAGLGQPVNVAGVKVGSIVGTGRSRGNALVTLEIERDELAEVHADARVELEPITPLKDMQVNLDPGGPPARALREDAVIPVARATSPVPLSNLLATLDADTRAYLQSLISALDTGTRDQAGNLSRLLRALGPTTRQVGAISGSLATRRRELSRLVGNIARVTESASRDGELATVVAAGNQTLQAIAAEDAPLQAALAKLPATLQTTRSTLTSAATFSRKLTPTLASLRPAVRRLPATFDALRPFAREATPALARDIRPFIREAQPLARDLAPTVTSLNGVTTPIWDSFQALQYLTNILAYNPPGRDEGNLFWLAWFGHNMNSAFGQGDAHGGAARAMIAGNCHTMSQLVGDLGTALRLLTGNANVCPSSKPDPEFGQE